MQIEPYVVGVTKEEFSIVAKGWSITKDLLHKDVYTDNAGDKVGTIDDIIVTTDKYFSYAVVSTGGFLGIDKHDIVIPVHQLKVVDGKFILPGATKERIKAMPEFVYLKQ